MRRGCIFLIYHYFHEKKKGILKRRLHQNLDGGAQSYEPSKRVKFSEDHFINGIKVQVSRCDLVDHLIKHNQSISTW